MERIKPETGYYYHVYNRGVDKRIVFLDTHDYRRFVSGLEIYNDRFSTQNTARRFVDRSWTPIKTRTAALVEVVCWCLMPNHYHLLLRQRCDDGISQFMHKVGTGYTNYFNERHNRSGALFQGKYKHVLVTSDEQLRYVMQYIHFNPIDLLQQGWKESGIKNPAEVLRFLKTYKWSDCDDYAKYEEIIRSYLVDHFGEVSTLVID